MIEKITAGKTAAIYEELLADAKYGSPHEFIGATYHKYSEAYPSNQNINGKIFEYLICETLAHEGIAPFYFQAQFTQVPNANFDIVLYHEKFPVVLTAKVSLRERYKQADLEGRALCNVYPSAKSHLITLDSAGAERAKIKIGEREIVGLKSCIRADDPEYSRLLEKLGKKNFTLAIPIDPIHSNRGCYLKENP